jgi:hypothetical protein
MPRGRRLKIERLPEITRAIGTKNACTIEARIIPAGAAFRPEVVLAFGSLACQLVALILQVRHLLSHPQQLRKLPMHASAP